MEEGNRKKSHQGEDKDSGSNPRRDFLKKFGLIGAAAATGGAAIYSGYHYERSKGKHKTVKVLTEDNRLVEIPVDQVKDITSSLKVLKTRGRTGIKSRRWVMVIDLSKCRNARQVLRPVSQLII